MPSWDTQSLFRRKENSPPRCCWSSTRQKPLFRPSLERIMGEKICSGIASIPLRPHQRRFLSGVLLFQSPGSLLKPLVVCLPPAISLLSHPSCFLCLSLCFFSANVRGGNGNAEVKLKRRGRKKPNKQMQRDIFGFVSRGRRLSRHLQRDRQLPACSFFSRRRLNSSWSRGVFFRLSGMTLALDASSLGPPRCCVAVVVALLSPAQALP